MKKTCTPIVMPYGTIAWPDTGMVVAPLHLSQSNTVFQLLFPLTSKKGYSSRALITGMRSIIITV